VVTSVDFNGGCTDNIQNSFDMSYNTPSSHF
jgi:hypothetical protein